MSPPTDPLVSPTDLFLLAILRISSRISTWYSRVNPTNTPNQEQWKHTSPLTPSAQRAHIFAEYTTLGVDGQQPYTTLLANAAAATTPSSPQPNEPSSTAHAPRRQTGAEGRVGFLIPWLRTAYHPSTDETSR
ncbi:uncharacterized protein BO95DRAFT_446392 [Aspergillus brunneoviolaceus CBS 621.78]|uniref:Uncharacterized protein n=1 Tax=Aspergillus brunneoviolaceus CBS 621.78 TaxID=1450534 RepID=A0ACD1FYL5_9EURO|nr:hypothetical protein BO95DRAFT_446392 [Aspergillus brunneoviolaceus CBS 621.78]RAH42103.1 hypothetical protein BO95DRAFT_446392 [Aspergillus brunneoviolaceus CBS 621.78]